MITLLSIVHVLVCLFLILVVLLQSGKGADLAGAFGGGGTQTALGARGAATLLGKLTTVMAIAFMLTSFTLAVMKSRGESKSLIKEIPAAEKVQTPQQAPDEAPGTEQDAQPGPDGAPQQGDAEADASDASGDDSQ